MKNILRLLILSSLIGLSGCQTEELFAEKTTSIYVKKKIAFEEFKKQTGINNLQSSFNIPTNTNAIHAKTANGRYELTDFDIETSQIIRFTNSHNKITFSFKIKPKNKVLLAKENYNLVYHKENNLWEQTIVYFEDIEVNNKTTYSNISRIYQSTNPIVVGSPMLSTFNSGGCSYTVSYVECDGTCDPGGPCMGFSCPDGGCVTTVMIFTACGPGGSGDPTNHGDNSENDGNIQGGGDLSFSPNTDLPVFPSASGNPCKMMKELVQPKPDKPSIKPEIDWLKTKVDESHEFGV